MSQPQPYENWPTDPHARWIAAGNTFGWHLMQSARDYALKRIAAGASVETRALAEKAVLDALYGAMMLLDGVASSSSGSVRVEYALLARVHPNGGNAPKEEFELAPGGDGLCLGFQGWRAGEFGP